MERQRISANPDRESHDSQDPSCNIPSTWTIQTPHKSRLGDRSHARAGRAAALTHSHTTGLRVTELAQLETSSVLHPSGAVRSEVHLSSTITKGSRAKNVYLTHTKCIDALERWMDVRLQRGWGGLDLTIFSAYAQTQNSFSAIRVKRSSLRSSIACSTAVRRYTGAVTPCNRLSVAFIVKRESREDRHTAVAAR
ncbi:integrase [Pseudomonas syringae BRIP39023]|nr:integrase [Pseudomonas syringae BRIP39023]